MKRLKFTVLVAAVFLLCVAAVSWGGGKKQDTAQTTNFKSSSPTYASYDLGAPKQIYIYMVGTTPDDLDEVIEKANSDYFKPILNTTVEVVFIPWSDVGTKYALILAGGDDVDIIFTAPWNYYEQESGKGSFVELTDQFISRWMPVTSKEQSRISWLQAMTRGKIYGVPSMNSGDVYKMPAIREDLRTKYNLPPLNDWAALRQYLFTVAQRESGLQAYNATASTWEVMNSYFQGRDVLLTEQPVYFAWLNKNNHEPSPEELVFLYMSDWYMDYANEMKDWMDRGVWSRNVMNNTIRVADAFTQGTSATVFWNETIYTLGESMEKNGIGKAGYYDVSPKSAVRRESYSNNLWAISSSSENPERAALVLDLMKTDVGLMTLLMGGIEGRHYLDQKDGTYLPGPEAADYTWNGWTWALNHPKSLQLAWTSTTPPQRIAITDSKRTRFFEPKIDGFRVDMSTISTEWAVISALVEEYAASFQCGVFGTQTEAKMREFRDRLRTAGADKVTTQFRTQYAEYLKNF
jgi:ABC-type glycerol-3-phosphate transport system substrate-binding protein